MTTGMLTQERKFKDKHLRVLSYFFMSFTHFIECKLESEVDMFLTYLKLKGFTRIAQNSIECLEVSFSQIMQILLGTNGSGKSSLLEQLSLLPPTTSSEFVKGGYKEAHALVDGCKWIAISDYGEKNGHYLEKDGVVLNNWGTASVQKQLLEEHLGLTQEVFDVQSNAKKFIYMSPNDRRDWVMKLSKIDIDPLMHKFMLAKNHQKEAKVYLKRVTERLKIEERNLVSENTLTELNTQLNELKDEFNFYSTFSEEMKTPTSLDLSQLASELNDLMEQTMHLYPVVPSAILKQGVVNPEQLRHLHTKKLAQADMLKQQFSKAMDELKEINRIAEAKAKLEEVGVEQSIQKLKQLEEEMGKYNADISFFSYRLSQNPHVAKNDFLRVLVDLKKQIFELPVNDDYRYNSQALNDAKAKDHALASRKVQLKEKIYQLEHQAKHIDDAQEISCPKCAYSFKHGIDPNERESIDQKLVNLKDQLERLNTEYETLQEFIGSCSDFIERVRSIYQVMSLTPSNKELWDVVKTLEIFKHNSFKAIELLDRHLEYLDLETALFDTTELYQKECDIYQKALENQGIVKEASTKDIAKIDELVFNLNQQIKDLDTEIRQLDFLARKFNHTDEQIDKISAMFDRFNEGYLTELDNDRARFIKETKFNIMKEINSVEQELEQARVKSMIYKDIEEQYNKAKAEYEDYTIIVDNLSPNTGLIADIMNDSINVFVENLNNVINAVWTTDLIVKPCINKKNDLDWKFPVEVDGGLIRPDISKTSTSQKDIINLGFQLMVSKNNSPLYLDELGSSMDEQHRINMMKVLSELVETERCSQLFLVSHFAAMHEQFHNSEIMVLNTKNIINMPRTYNQHVTIS